MSKEYDEVLDDEKYEKYIIDKKIVKENLGNEWKAHNPLKFTINK